MDEPRDEFEKELDDELAGGTESVEEPPLITGEDDSEDEDEDELLDKFGLHRVEEGEESDF